MNESEINNEDKMLGLFSHLSIFFGAIIIPIIFWAIKKDKSKFVAFHALQALFFHLAYVAVIVIFIFVMVIGGLGLGFLGAGSIPYHSSGASVIFIIIMVIFYIGLFISMFGVMGYSIYMGIKAYNGELKKYPIIGNIVYKRVYKVQS